jgi:hypothetical protein
VTDPQKDAPGGGSPAPARQINILNFGLTIGLLAFGAVTLASNLGDYAHPADVINQLLTNLHQSDAKFPDIAYSATRLATSIGILLLTLQGANFGLITWWSVTRLRERKTAFWVPLIGAFVSSALTFVAVLVLLLSDPAVLNAMVEYVKASASAKA